MSQTITVTPVTQTVTLTPAQTVIVDRPEQVVTIVPSGPPGPPGPAGTAAGRYVHNQSAPAAQWTIAHGLGTHPNVVLELTATPGEPVYTDVLHTDLNTTLVTWPSPESGKAYLS